MKNIFFAAVILLAFACGSEKEKQPTSESDPVLEKIAGKDYAKLIELPTTRDGKIDTAQMANIWFENMSYHFDTINEGDRITHTFSFLNTGKKDLYILETNSTCGCTVPNYSEKPIPPGKKGEITVTFDSQGKTGKQNRKIALITNAFPSEKIISLEGFVKQMKRD